MHTMKRTILSAVLLVCAFSAAAQEAGRIYRTEVTPYDTRHDAAARNRAGSGHRIEFAPETMAAAADGSGIAGQTIDIPYTWTDGEVYLHLENVPAAYELWVNDRQVARVDDAATPAEFALTPYIRQGGNDLRLLILGGGYPQIDAPLAPRTPYADSYLYYQNKRSIRDFEIALVPDTLGRDFAMLDLAIIVRNGYNYEEPVTVGYDIYSPEGKLLDFNIAERTLPGRSVDTLRFQPFIYGAYRHPWGPGAKRPPLYDVMLFTRRDGTYKEYMPLRVGFDRVELVDDKWMRFGKEIHLKEKRYNAAPDEKTTARQLEALRKEGYNTLRPDYPQPAWFYALCDSLGLYVIDRANIHAPEKRMDRTVGGTPSNDPALADEYLRRVKAMYYRSRNFTSVIAYALGGPAGNGYNMYKAYEWLKGVEHARPVIYEDADGEWNSDL